MAVGAADDWLVADSEDEGAFVRNLASPDASMIQTAAFSLDQPRTPQRGSPSPSTFADESLFTPLPPGVDSTIGNFTDAPSASGAPSMVLPKQRPRPRVVIKKSEISNQNVDKTSTSSFSHISDRPISATRRTIDSIHPVTPATAASFGLFDTVEDAYSSLDIAERAKMRSRKSQTTKKPVHPPYQMNEVIELTSDEDELALKPTKRQKKQGNPTPIPSVATKPRPKPTLRVKPKAVLPSGSPSGPAVVPDSQAPPAQQASSSQLPASTLPTVPPSTPSQARELTPLSSPLATTRKRKRARPLIVEDDDEMDIIGGNSTSVSPSFTEPPLFFAPSSSVPTDSGVEIPPAESSLGARGKKKQVSSKKGTQRKTQNKGRRGNKAETTPAVDEAIEESARITHESSTSADHSSSFAKEQCSSGAKNSTTTEKASRSKNVTKKVEARAMDSCEEEDGPVPPSMSNTARTPPTGEREGQRSKENLRPADSSPPKRDLPPEHTSTPGIQARGSSVKPSPMAELIRRVNSQPSSPFPNATRTYSPFLKSSRTMLSRIAPLHPNRRTPPPPLPRPPPPKKSKKQLAMEEKIEEELAETIEGWSCLTDEERKALRKARIDAELGYE